MKRSIIAREKSGCWLFLGYKFTFRFFPSINSKLRLQFSACLGHVKDGEL